MSIPGNTAAAGSRAAIVLLLCLAGWPVVRWYIVRASDGSDEPWGLAPLAAALIFAPRTGWREALSAERLRFLCALVGLYALSFNFIPPLGHALIFATTLAVAVHRRGFPLAWWALLVISLPLISTIQFYAGYPLRLTTTILCIPLLRLGGMQVAAEGTALRWAGETVVVDAPCSGIHMLWTGLFLAAALACWLRLDTRGTARLLHRAGIAVFVANVLRAAALFCIESKIWPSPAWAHEGIGLLLFGLAAIGIYLASESLSKRTATPAAP
jgi:exosortase/archaeosortase family protein